MVRLEKREGIGDPNRAGDHNGETALHHAASGGNVEMVRLLLEAGANSSAKTIPGMRTYAFMRDVRVRGETPLHRAAAFGSAEVIQLLLDAGADMTIRDANDDTPLSWSSWYSRHDKMNLVWYAGAEVGPDIPR